MEPSDEPKRDAAGPSVPGDRNWRHPTEMHDPDPDRMPAVAVPPPVRRRTAAIIALLAVTSSVVLLTVALPGAVPAGTPEPAAGGGPTTVPAKGGAGTLRGIEFMDGLYAVPTAELDGKKKEHTVSTPDGKNHPAENLAAIPELGVTVLSSSGTPSRCKFMLLYDDDEFAYLLSSGSLKIRDRSGNILSVNASLDLEPEESLDPEHEEIIPLSVNGELDGVGVLLGPDDQIVGIVAEVEHATVALLMPAVEKIICDA